MDPGQNYDLITSFLQSDPTSALSAFLHYEVRRCRQQIRGSKKRPMELSSTFILEEDHPYPDYIALWNALITLDCFLVMARKERTKKNAPDLKILELARAQKRPSFRIIPDEFVRVEEYPGYLTAEDRDLFVSTKKLFERAHEGVQRQMLGQCIHAPTNAQEVVPFRETIANMHHAALDLLVQLRK